MSRPSSTPITALFGAALVATLCAGQAHALDAACERVVAASEKKLAAPAFHDRKALTGLVQELIAVDGKLYQRSTFGAKTPGAWERAPITLADIRAAAGTYRSQLVACSALGRETVEGVATDIIGFKIKAGATTAEGRVWIGTSDGLPYREEAPGLQGTTVYRNVKAPL